MTDYEKNDSDNQSDCISNKGGITVSTLEKAIDLLQTMPENKLEAVYMYMRFVSTQTDSDEAATVDKKGASSIVGIAHQYANPELIPLEEEAFANAMAEKHAIN